MLQTTFINVRTLSFAFVMATMLMVGTSFSPQSAEAQMVSDSALRAQIAQLLQLVAELQKQLDAQGTDATTAGYTCIELNRSLYLGVDDASTGGQVGKLQRFLQNTGHFTYGEITGYFGPATQLAVQRWQAANGVVSSGNPETTGFGLVGTKTRAAMSRGCEVRDNQPASADTDVEYRLEVTNPDERATYEIGDSITLRWNEKNLGGEQGVITLEGGPYNVERHIKQRVEIGDGRATVVIPANDRSVVPGEYELKVWVSYIKDGDPKGVRDSVRISIVDSSQDENDSSSADLQEQIDFLLEQIDNPQNIPSKSEREKMSERELQAVLNNLMTQIDAQQNQDQFDGDQSFSEEEMYAQVTILQYSADSEAIGGDTIYLTDGSRYQSGDPIPLTKDGRFIEDAMSYADVTDFRAIKGLYLYREGNGRVQIRQYGNLGADGQSEPSEYTTGEVKVFNGSFAENAISAHQLESRDDARFNANQTSINFTFNLAGPHYDGFVFRVVESDEGNEEDVISSVSDASQIYVIGAHESKDRNGVITVNMQKSRGLTDGGLAKDLTLVLSAYEPITWNIAGDAADWVQQVIVTGYHTQKVTGLNSNIPVLNTSYEAGDSEYYSVYERDSREQRELYEYVNQLTGQTPYLFWGAYEQDEVNPGLKG